jgi:hypothetical protein
MPRRGRPRSVGATDGSTQPARGALAILALVLSLSANAQPIHPTLAGDALLAALAADYAPTATFSYDRARDSLFAVVYRETGDSLRCRYSGLAIWIDPSLDPTTAAWNASPRVSTEHLWPQNRGATEGTPAYADLHHLVPAQQSINSSRLDHPFGEVDDALADRWWGPTPGYATTPPPLAVRDLYSEKLNAGEASLFEPREGVAGDVARALFYVWTVYGPSGTGQLDAAFWPSQRDALLDWHAEDPPDAAETQRTLRIAAWQGTPNPFVLDATLAERAFAPLPVADAPAPPLPAPYALSAPAPNPASELFRATLALEHPAYVLAVVTDVLGREVAVLHDGPASGILDVLVDAIHLPSGIYTLRVSVSGHTVAVVSRLFTVAR